MSIVIQSIFDQTFKKYGMVLNGYNLEELICIMKDKKLPTDDTVYEASVEELEHTDAAQEIRKHIYGGLEIEIGFCGGYNKKLNGLEYHRGSEVNIACRDMVVLLGCLQDVDERNNYDTSKVEAFLVPAGKGVEFYGTTLHFAPCTAKGQETFCSICVLPKGTNTELDFEADRDERDVLLTAKNKWLIVHEEAGIEGAYAGLKGENITID